MKPTPRASVTIKSILDRITFPPFIAFNEAKSETEEATISALLTHKAVGGVKCTQYCPMLLTRYALTKPPNIIVTEKMMKAISIILELSVTFLSVEGSYAVVGLFSMKKVS